MATKKEAKEPSKSAATVTRIKAKDTKDTKRTVAEKEKVPKKETVKKPVAAKEKADKKPSKNVFKAAGNYFKGAWEELRQVRWPNRRATWSLTAAVLLFTTFFVVLILLLDALFKYLFELILG